MTRSVGEAVDFLNSLPDGGVHQVICDPPWQIGWQGGSVRGENPLKGTINYATHDPRLLIKQLKVLQRKLVPGGYVYMFLPGAEPGFEALRAVEEDGWNLRRFLIWDKALQGRSGMGNTWRNAFEPILVMTNGTPRSLSPRGCWSSMLRQKPKHTRTAKPSELYRVLMEASTEPGDLVVDPWCGLDPLSVAAPAIGRRWASNDILTPDEVLAQARER